MKTLLMTVAAAGLFFAACTAPCPEQKLLMAEHAALDSVSQAIEASHAALEAAHTTMSAEHKSLAEFLKTQKKLDKKFIEGVDTTMAKMEATHAAVIAAHKAVVDSAKAKNAAHLEVEKAHAAKGAACDQIKKDYETFKADHAAWQAAHDKAVAEDKAIAEAHAAEVKRITEELTKKGIKMPEAKK